MSYIMKIAHCAGPDFALYSGNDDITIPLMSVGGSGVISVYANVMPAMCHQIVADYLANIIFELRIFGAQIVDLGCAQTPL